MGLSGLSETSLFWIEVLSFIGIILVIILVIKIVIKIMQKQMMMYYKQEKRKDEITQVFNDLVMGQDIKDVEKKFKDFDLCLQLIKEEQIYNGVYKRYKVPLDWKYSVSKVSTKGDVMTNGIQNSMSMGSMNSSYSWGHSSSNSVVNTSSEVLKDAVIFLNFENNQLVLKDQEGLN